MKVTALLPMKAHSERVPNKNFRKLGFKPLYRWMLDSLLRVPSIERVMINTDAGALLDDRQLQAMSRVELRRRPEAVRGDLVSMNRVIACDLEACDGDVFLMTHATNPFISTETIERCLEHFAQAQREGYDSVFSVTSHQSRFYDAQLRPINHHPNELVRTQDLPVVYEENSCLYVFTRHSFERTQARIGNRPCAFVTPRRESLDIDNLSDWEEAELWVAQEQSRPRYQGERIHHG